MKRAAVLVFAACAPETSSRSAAVTPSHYEIRVAEHTLGANGHTKREVFVFGKQPDDSFATDAVVVSVDPPTAGTFTKTSLTLGALGATTHFTPCNQIATGCLGSATIKVSLASAPTTPIATAAIELVAPTHVSTAAPCQRPGTTLYLDGNDHIRNGMLKITEWQQRGVEVYSPLEPRDISLFLSPTRITQGNNWDIRLDTLQTGAPLAPGIYANAVRWHSTTTGVPGMAVTGNGSGCNTITGAFEIHELTISSELDALTMSFEQRCESGVKLLEGCIRYEK